MLRKNRFCHSDPGGILSNMVGRIEEVPRRRVLVACRDHPLPTRGELWLMLPRPPAPTRSRAGRASRDARCGRTRALRPRRAPPSWIERDRVGVDHRALERRHRGRRVRRRPRGDRPAELAPHAASAPRRSRRPAPGCRGPCSGTAGRRAPPPSRTPCAGGASWFTGPRCSPRRAPGPADESFELGEQIALRERFLQQLERSAHVAQIDLVGAGSEQGLGVARVLGLAGQDLGVPVARVANATARSRQKLAP